MARNLGCCVPRGPGQGGHDYRQSYRASQRREDKRNHHKEPGWDPKSRELHGATFLSAAMLLGEKFCGLATSSASISVVWRPVKQGYSTSSAPRRGITGVTMMRPDGLCGSDLGFRHERSRWPLDCGTRRCDSWRVIVSWTTQAGQSQGGLP